MKAGIQAIIRKINADAERHAGERYAQQKSEIDEKIAAEIMAYSNELAKRRELQKKHNEHEYILLIDRLKGRLGRELLTYQHSLTDEIFDMAAAKLKKASKQEFFEMFKAVIKILRGRFDLQLGELSEGMLNKKDVELALEETGRADIEINWSGGLIPKKSGFVLGNEQIEYNCLFEDLISDKKNGQAALVMKEVFGDGEKR
jgi:hypothetical protein